MADWGQVGRELKEQAEGNKADEASGKTPDSSGVTIGSMSADRFFAGLVAGVANLPGHSVSLVSAAVAQVTRKVAPTWTKWLAGVGVALCLLNLSFVQNFVAILWAALALPLLFVRDTETAVVTASEANGGTTVVTSGQESPEFQAFMDKFVAECNATSGTEPAAPAPSAGAATETLAAHPQAAPGITSGPAPDSTIESIRHLADLRERGMLTDEEFTSEKARILGRTTSPDSA